MKFRSWQFVLQTLAVMTAVGIGSAAFAQDDDKETDEDNWQVLFDGKSLDGWDGDPRLWSVEDGAITGKTTDEFKLTENSFLVWQGGDVDNFELELEYRIVNGNSGIQYRSFKRTDTKGEWSIGGYQADFEAGDTYSGILYGEAFRGILAQRGDVTELTRDDGRFIVTRVRSIGDTNEIQKQIKKEDWNKYRIVASGFRFQHFINGPNGQSLPPCFNRERRQVLR